MSTPAPPAPAGQTIGLDAAAKLLRMSPNDLQKLAGDGVIPRVSPGQFHPGAIIAAYIEHLRTEPDRRERSMGQAEIAAHLDISDRRLRDLLTEWNINHKQTTLTDIRLRYIRKLREEAAGRQAKADDALDLVEERALLAREQRIKIAMDNAATRGEFAPISLLTDVLATAAAAVSDRLDALPAAIYRAQPDLPGAVRSAIENTVHKARSEWRRVTSKILLDELDDNQDDPDTDDTTAAILADD
jgi:phage terminase Nu1 subunit (DNA packaging protein)